MPRPYSVDLREHVIAAVEQEGMSRHEAAAQFRISVSTAIKWVQRFRRTGSAAPGQIGGYKQKAISGAHRDWLMARCQANEFTLRGLVSELATRDLKIDCRAVWSFVHTEGLSFKKTLTAAERDRPDVVRRRALWRKYQGLIDPTRPVFIDETWTKTNMAWPAARRFVAGRPVAAGSMQRCLGATGTP